MDEEKIVEKIMIQIQKKFNQANEFLNLTTEMSGALGRNDQVSFTMLMGMRQDVIGIVNSIEEEIEHLLGQLSDERCALVRQCIKTGGAIPEQPKEKRICDISQSTKNIFKKAGTIDSVMSKKLNGK